MRSYLAKKIVLILLVLAEHTIYGQDTDTTKVSKLILIVPHTKVIDSIYYKDTTTLLVPISILFKKKKFFADNGFSHDNIGILGHKLNKYYLFS